ncbi:hypothetical protein [Streptomyces sp. GS7]|uniref:hypothetical protein n=1 Tax=Streptomyces sp. GS7 TaxID=2692234 RepID=UPI001317EBEE|nr:hypothetical protein GR130_16975 [Streptomyces sp. GS7]
MPTGARPNTAHLPQWIHTPAICSATRRAGQTSYSSDQPLVQVARPLLGPASEFGDGVLSEAVGGELLVVVPLGASEPVAQITEAEGVAPVAFAELLEFPAGAVFGGRVHVDEVPDGAAVG